MVAEFRRCKKKVDIVFRLIIARVRGLPSSDRSVDGFEDCRLLTGSVDGFEDCRLLPTGEDRGMLSISDGRRSNTETASRILTQSDDKLAGR